MRAQPEMEATAASPKLIHLSPPLHQAAASTCGPHAHGCRWWPYSNSNDFGANTAMILILLLCALICALLLNTAIRCFLRSARQSPEPNPQAQGQLGNHVKTSFAAGSMPLVVGSTLVYSARVELGGAAPDCPICLSEFVEGEEVRVLGSCKHGFHLRCIQTWLSSHSSCPTCRRSCLPASPWPQTQHDATNAPSLSPV